MRVFILLPDYANVGSHSLNHATSGTLALLGDGGYPYSLPISFVYADDKIFFHSALKGHKIDAIRSCDKSSFSVIQNHGYLPRDTGTLDS